MILSAVRDYLEQHGQATLADIALHFDMEPAALQGMLEVWIDKGKVSRTDLTASCGNTCSRCDPASTELYVWCEAESGSRLPSPSACRDR